jgi:uncharacterized membrane protein HdeD (DUF308 family)
VKNFFKENFWCLLLAIVAIGAIAGIAYIPDGNWARKLILSPFYIIGAITFLVGIWEIIGYLSEKNCIKQTWQGILTFLILALSIIVLAL